MSEVKKAPDSAREPAPPARYAERVAIAIAVEDGNVAMRFGTGKLILPPPAALNLADRLRAAAQEADPKSDVAKAALAVAAAQGGVT